MWRDTYFPTLSHVLEKKQVRVPCRQAPFFSFSVAEVWDKGFIFAALWREVTVLLNLKHLKYLRPPSMFRIGEMVYSFWPVRVYNSSQIVSAYNLSNRVAQTLRPLISLCNLPLFRTYAAWKGKIFSYKKREYSTRLMKTGCMWNMLAYGTGFSFQMNVSASNGEYCLLLSCLAHGCLGFFFLSFFSQRFIFFYNAIERSGWREISWNLCHSKRMFWS